METVFNNEMKLCFPEGFRMFTEEEMKKQNFIKEGPGNCLKDEERHIVISVAWKKVGLLGRLVRPEEAVRSMEKQIAAPMKDYAYSLEDFMNKRVGDTDMYGFRYSYRVQDTGMTGESFILEKDRTFYYLHVYYRTEIKESRKVWDDILCSLEWV
ncbi:MAG: hypothetical protein IKF68_06085 [Erysipelotrichaceae bacterium]|nr:hypothetical protein [Erysipelotrichaceae bacterium]